MSFIKNSTEISDEGEFVVVLDAGHGGHDPGNLGNGYLEKNIALNIVLQVGAVLEKTPNIKVIYTRNDDTFIDLFVRGEIANKANADLFVSVHCDSHSSDAHGAGTFVLGLHANKQNFEIAKKENSVIYLEDDYESRYSQYNINSPESVIGLTIMQEEFLNQSVRLAQLLQDNFSGKLKRTNRKVKQAGFIVLHQTFMPSVLVETGFLTNKEEGSYLNSKKGQVEMGSEIAKAIMTYRREIVGNSVTTAAPKPKVIEEVVEKVEPKKPEPKIENEISKESEVTVITKEVKEELKKDGEVAASEDAKIAVKEPENEKGIEMETQKPKEVVVKTIEKASSTVVFKVQIMASTKNLALNPPDFKGLNVLSKEQYKNMFRYMYGNTNSYSQAKLLKSNADAKGYTTSYIVAYKDGKRVKVSEVLKDL